MATICGSTPFAGGTTFSMSLSSFQPNPNGLGGSIDVYLNGQLIATWNVTDDKGNIAPNSFYHFILEEHPTDGNPVLLERDAFIAPNQGGAISLSAWPNVGHPGDLIQFSASFAGIPADGQSKIKIYAASGELVKNLDVANGVTSWDLTNASSQQVASGIYIAVLAGINPASGQKLHSIVKILVLH